jgi:hypothetical protein
VFIGNSLQPYLGAPVLDFSYSGGSVVTTLSGSQIFFVVAPISGHHEWPKTNEALASLPSGFSIPTTIKVINMGLPWSSGANGNAWRGPALVSGTNPDTALAVVLIRRESDGAPDFFVSAIENQITPPPQLDIFRPYVNREILINGTRWRTCGVIAQLMWDSALGRVLQSRQVGKTTYLDQEKARTLNFTAALSATFPGTPYARCDFSIYCGPRVGGTLGALRVANAATSTGRLIGFNPMQSATQTMSFNYTAPPDVSGSQIFSVAFNVSDFQVRLLGWTEETLPKLGF